MKKRILSITLIVTLICSLCTNIAYAADVAKGVDESGNAIEFDLTKEKITIKDPSGEAYIVPITSSNYTFEEFGISDIANALKSDPKVSNVQLDGNVLTYTLPNDIDARIVETVDDSRVHSFEITEGNQTDNLTFDSANNEVLLNDEPIVVSMREAYVIRQIDSTDGISDLASRNTTWIYMTTSYPHIQAESIIRNMTSSILYTIMLAPLGWIGVSISVAIIIVDTAIALNSNSKDIYVIRDSYHDITNYGYKYIDYHYLNSDYTDYVTTKTTEIWT